MPKQEAALKFTVDGKTYVVKLADLSGVEVKEFRQQVGIPPSVVFRDPNAVDLDVIAGFIWIARRRKEKALTYDAVAGSLNYGSDLEGEVEGTDDDTTEIEDDDPEA